MKKSREQHDESNHLRDDKKQDIILTDALGKRFINMVIILRSLMKLTGLMLIFFVFVFGSCRSAPEQQPLPPVQEQLPQEPLPSEPPPQLAENIIEDDEFVFIDEIIFIVEEETPSPVIVYEEIQEEEQPLEIIYESVQPDDPFNSTIYLLDRGTLPEKNVNAVFKYILNDSRTRNIPQSPSGDVFQHSSVREIIEIYFDEAEKENVNPYLAIAQMLCHTNFFSESRMQQERRQTHNYGALSPVRTAPTQYWDGSGFSGRQVGIRAHIQHLRRLANGSLADHITLIVDPRWDLVPPDRRGTMQTWDEASSSWAEREGYRNDVIGIYDELTEFVRGN